jgi:hypothetical protein
MDNQEFAPVTCCFTKAGLAVGTTSTLTQTLVGGATGNVLAIRGKTYLVAALSNTATPTADWATGKAFFPVLANQGCVFMIGFSAAGGLKAIQGQVCSLDANGNFVTAPQFGGLGPAGSGSGAGGGADFCPIGYLVVQAGSTANNTTGWTFGTNNMSSVTGLTWTLDDVCGITDRPQVS